MSSVVDRFKNIVIYVNHDDNIIELNCHNIVANQITELLEVLSPKKVPIIGKKFGEMLPIVCTNMRNRRVDPDALQTIDMEDSGKSNGSGSGSDDTKD
jgi:hypothetical protein